MRNAQVIRQPPVPSSAPSPTGRGDCGCNDPQFGPQSFELSFPPAKPRAFFPGMHSSEFAFRFSDWVFFVSMYRNAGCVLSSVKNWLLSRFWGTGFSALTAGSCNLYI